MTTRTDTSWAETRYAHNGDISLAYDRLHRGSDGEPLLLIMGSAISRSWWPLGMAEAGFAVLRHINLRQVAKFAVTKHPHGRAGDASAATMAMRGLVSSDVPIDEDVLQQWTELDEDSGIRDPAAMSRQLGATWHGPRLRQLRAPTLIMHGLDDPLLKVSAAIAMVQAIPGAKLVVHSGVGHYIPRWIWPDIARKVAWHAADPPPLGGSDRRSQTTVSS